METLNSMAARFSNYKILVKNVLLEYIASGDERDHALVLKLGAEGL